MSQSSSQALDPGWVSVPLAKFSHSSSPFGTGRIHWKHVGSRNDLDIVLRSTRIVAENGIPHHRPLMKITAGTEELEQQDLYELLQHIRSFNPSRDKHNKVQLIIRAPSLAMTYPKSATMKRRIRLQFHDNAGCTRILSFLKDLGFPVTVPKPASTPVPPSLSRPRISPSPSLVSDTSASASLAAPSIFSVSSVSSSSSRLSLPLPGFSPQPSITGTDDSVRIASDPMISQFNISMWPNSSFSEPLKLMDSFNYTNPSISRPAATSNVFPLTAPQSSQTYMHPPSSVYMKQTEHESQGHNPSLPRLLVMRSNEDIPRPDLPLYQSQLELHNRSAPERLPHADLRPTNSPFFSPQIVTPCLNAYMTRELNPPHNDRQTQDLATMDFQTRNAALFEAAEQHRLLIPPKRQLPFGKPREAVSCSTAVSKFSYSPIPPPVPRPRPLNPANGQAKNQGIERTKEQDSPIVEKPTKKCVAKHKPTVAKPSEVAESPPPIEQACDKVNPVTSVILPQDKQSPLAAKSLAASSRPASAASALPSKATSTAQKKRAAPTGSSPIPRRLKVVDQSSQTDVSDKDPAVLQLVQNKTSTPSVATVNACSPIVRSSPPDRYLDAVDTFVAQHSTRPVPKEIWDQPGWSEADEEERHRIINNFICDNLENKDFINLCGDVRNSWRRMMGMEMSS